MMESGKTRRLRRIFRDDSKTLIIAMDHGVTMGPVQGLENMQQTVKQVVTGGADAVLMHKGIAKRIDTSNAGLIVHVSASTKLGDKPNLKVGVCSVEEAVRIGADAISSHTNIGSEEESKTLEFLGSLADQCDAFGMPLLAMMYPWTEHTERKWIRRSLTRCPYRSRTRSRCGQNRLHRRPRKLQKGSKKLSGACRSRWRSTNENRSGCA